VRVIVNRFSTLGQKTGIGHYTAELLRCLTAQAPAEIACFPSGLAWRLGHWWGKARPALSRGENDATAQAASWWIAWKKKVLQAVRTMGQAYLARQLNKELRREHFDLYHEPNTIPLPGQQATITTVHDLSVLLHPEWHPLGRVAFFEKRFLPSLPHSRHFITVSDFTRRQMINVLGVPGERVTRVYNGIRPDLRPLPEDAIKPVLNRLGLPASYLLHVGTIEPRKNLLRLLQAYTSLPGSLREKCPLLLVGGWGWSSRETATYFHDEARHNGVLHLGYAGNDDLPALYNGARALVCPSLYEGFGLPPLEMLACGGAVLASTADAVAEIVGGRAHLIDPLDGDGWRSAMARLIADDEWRAELRRGAVATAAPFTWDRCAAETLALYRAACGEHAERRAA
jgi:O-antigen biosynthesis alpha-1,3-rhamnosyltransferase